MSPAPTDIPIVLIAVMACVGGLVLTAGVVVGLYCFAVVWKRGKKKKGKKGDRLSLSSEASDVPLHPIVKVQPGTVLLISTVYFHERSLPTAFTFSYQNLYCACGK